MEIETMACETLAEHASPTALRLYGFKLAEHKLRECVVAFNLKTIENRYMQLDVQCV